MSRLPLTRPALRSVGSLVGTLAGATVCALCLTLPATALAQSNIDVDLRDGRLTLRTDAVPAEQLAEALYRATGIAFVVTGEPGTPLSADIVDEPLDKAIALLSPNHMLVREDARPDAAIVEVVLMMPDGDGGGSDNTEFLPSGDSVDDAGINAQPGGPPDFEFEEVEYDENGLPIDPATLRDPGRADAVRDATMEPVQELDANGLPLDGSMDGFDPEPQIDPTTGEIVQP